MIRFIFMWSLSIFLLTGCAGTVRVATQIPPESESGILDAAGPPLMTGLGGGSWRSGPLDLLSRPLNAEIGRASSWDRTGGNYDAKIIEPGQTITLAQIEGPAVVTHIWCTVAAEEFYSRKLILRVWWDGADEPSIEAPLGDFFAVGHGIDRPVNSLPIRVSSEGRARNCYWTMPFRKSARFEIENQGVNEVRRFYYYIDYRRVPELPKDELYFHARYRQEWPCPKVELDGINRDGAHNYVILQTEGRGTYVGCNLSITNNQAGWWGEGDDFFWIDGESEPRMIGTGSEDYFCDAWGMREIEGPFYGCPLFTGLYTGDVCTVYRFHVADPVPFKKSIKFAIEHGHANDRSDDFSSVAYWYQDQPFQNRHGLFTVPPVEERLSPQARARLVLPKFIEEIKRHRQAGHLENAVATAADFIEMYPGLIASDLLYLLAAEDNMALGREEMALKLYTELAQAHPDSDAGKAAQGALWRRGGNHRGTITAACDNVYTLFLDGVELGSCDDYRIARTFGTLLSPGKHVIAVQANNGIGTCGFVAAVRAQDLTVLTNDSWKVTRDVQEGWKTLEYDDSNWIPATVHGQGFDSAFYDGSELGLPGIPEKTGWIWAEENTRDEDVVYFRKTLVVTE